MHTLLEKFGIAELFFAALFVSNAAAQHIDIDFEYHDGMIEVEFGSEGRVFESDFPTSGGFEQFTDDPGFGTHEPLNPGDIIDYIILGPLEYHDGKGFASVPAGVGILISDNPSGGLTVTNSTVGPISGSGAIGVADSGGEVHTHIDFTLTPGEFDEGNNPPAGAYALLMELTTSAMGIANSDPFYLVFNFGLEEDEMLPGPHFHEAVEAFAAKIPEPSTMMLSSFGVAVWSSRRQRISSSTT